MHRQLGTHSVAQLLHTTFSAITQSELTAQEVNQGLRSLHPITGNPEPLSLSEVDAVATVATEGSCQAAALLLGKTEKTLRNQLAESYAKLGPEKYYWSLPIAYLTLRKLDILPLSKV